MEYFEEITDVVEHGSGTGINRAHAVRQIISQAPLRNSAYLLRQACEVWGGKTTEETELEQVIGEDECKQFKERLGKLVDTILEGLIKANPTETEFYERLWATITSPVFQSEREQAFALYWVIIDKRTPYFEVGEGVSMPNEKFRTINKRLAKERARIRFTSKREFEQKTQRASVLLNQLLAVDGDDRIVLMVSLLDELKPGGDLGGLLGGLGGLLGALTD